MPHYFGPPAVRRSSRYEILEDAAIKDMVCEPTYNAVKVGRYLGTVYLNITCSVCHNV